MALREALAGDFAVTSRLEAGQLERALDPVAAVAQTAPLIDRALDAWRASTSPDL